jgi:hypothetical protein
MGLPNASQTMTPWRGWWPIVVLPSAVILLTPPDWPRWLLMWSLAFAIFVGCKWLTWRRTLAVGVPWWRHAGYLVAWPGMNAPAFLCSELPTREEPGLREWGLAGMNVVWGAVIFWRISRLASDGQEILSGWFAMVGLILMLHFGVFHLLSCGWRAIGVDARPLMKNPLASVSVSEFWGKRWNTAFRDLTHRFLFRPFAKKLGPSWAHVAAFILSGFVHDLVISVPAGGGYGGPTLFFVIQVGALRAERSRFGLAVGLGHGWRGWLFTMLVLAVPAYGLFHFSASR